MAKISPKIDVVYTSESKSLANEKLINQILRNKKDSLTFKVFVHKSDKSSTKLKTSSIMIFDSAESFREMSSKIVWQTDRAARHQHLVYFPGASDSDLETINDGFPLDNVNLLVEREDSIIDLMSSFMFTSKACWRNQFIKINQFKKSSTEWDTSNFYPNKYRNLHHCELYINRSTVNKYTDKAMQAFGKFVNSTLIDSNIYKGMEKKTVLIIDDLGTLNVHFPEDYLVVGYPHDIKQYVFYIPPGEEYSPLEKMLLPFDDVVWIGIAVTLLIGFIMIQLINLAGSKIKKFVFGRNVTSPTMNMIDILLNGSQVKTAGRNFARFIFMLFVIWCLIFRTCYQSKLFEFLQSNKRKQEATTVYELYEKNFTFMIQYESSMLLKQIEQLFENGER